MALKAFGLSPPGLQPVNKRNKSMTLLKMKFICRPIVFLITLAMIVTNVSFYPSTGYALSADDEKKMGDEFILQIKHHYEIIDDDFANQYFTELGKYLTSQIENQHLTFHFYLIKDKTLNAFAGPGGHIFFFAGLIDVMDSADELAAILSHEIGHITARHLANRIEQNKKIGLATMAGILAGVLIGGEVASALMVGSMAAGVQAQMHYSRNDERQADQLSYKYMARTGFNPQGLISTLKKIEKSSWMGTNQIPNYLLTHPTGPERMSNLDSMLSDYKKKEPTKEAVMFNNNFRMFQTVVRAKGLETQIAEKFFKDALKEDPDSVSAHFGLGLVHEGKTDYREAIRHLNRALEKQPASVPIIVNLGKIYQTSGEDKKAISVFNRAMKLSYEDNSIAYLMGISYENLEKYEKAIRMFERLTYFNPVSDDVYYHLGMSYGKLDNLLHAHYNFGIYFKRIGKMQKATFHFKKAFDFCTDDPVMKEKISKEKDSLIIPGRR